MVCQGVSVPPQSKITALTPISPDCTSRAGQLVIASRATSREDNERPERYKDWFGRCMPVALSLVRSLSVTCWTARSRQKAAHEEDRCASYNMSAAAGWV